jgi:hypothetical protein
MYKVLLLSSVMFLPMVAHAEPFIQGYEPGWGRQMSPKQRRATGFIDLQVALETNRKPNAPTAGVQSYAFNVLTFRHAIHGHGGGGGDGGAASGNSGGVNINIGGGGGGQSHANPPVAPPFMISQIKSEPFGVFATLQECDMARGQKIAELDEADLRFPHQRSNAPTRTITTASGAVIQEQVPSQERSDVTFCEPGIYAAPKLSPEIARIQTTGAAMPVAQTTVLEVPPGFVKHWVAPRPFSRVFPGTSDAVEILSASERELVFMTKPDNTRPTNILLANDDGEVVANLRIVIPGSLNTEIQQGPDGYQIYHKDNPNYVASKDKK